MLTNNSLLMSRHIAMLKAWLAFIHMISIQSDKFIAPKKILTKICHFDRFLTYLPIGEGRLYYQSRELSMLFGGAKTTTNYAKSSSQ